MPRTGCRSPRNGWSPDIFYKSPPWRQYRFPGLWVRFLERSTPSKLLSTGNTQGKYYGLDNSNPMLLAFQAYLDQNDVGTSYYELIYNRAIVFHKQ